MKKIIFIIIISFIMAISFLILKNFKKNENLETKLDCDLNIKSCDVKFKERDVNFEFLTKPIIAMKPVKLRIKGIDLDNKEIKISGISMNMGDIKSKLKKNGDFFETNIVFSTCLLKTMRYKIEVVGKKDLFTYFDLKH